MSEGLTREGGGEEGVCQSLHCKVTIYYNKCTDVFPDSVSVDDCQWKCCSLFFRRNYTDRQRE